MAAPNGLNALNPAAPYPMGGAMMPNAGQHNDMNYVWTLVEELSGILETNREKWHELQAGIARAQVQLGDIVRNRDLQTVSHISRLSLEKTVNQSMEKSMVRTPRNLSASCRDHVTALFLVCSTDSVDFLQVNTYKRL